MQIVFSEPLPARRRGIRLCLYAVWAAVTLILVLNHTFWRDEVRALTIALGGDSLPAMLRGLHGEGHPALWYLLLRFAHALVPVGAVMPAANYAIAAAASALFVFRSPFRPWLIALVLASGFMLTEYPVVARNYGIAMLALFALAILYPRHRDRGVAIGLLLALLCNTNVPAALLAAAFLLFWLVELIGEEGLRWGPKYRLFLLNAAIAAIGALLCFVTVYPTVNDAAPLQVVGGIGPGTILRALLLPHESLSGLVPAGIRQSPPVALAFDIVVLGSLLGFARAPAALLSALAALFSFELFFRLIYPGYYRHDCLLIVYMIALHWLMAGGRGGAWHRPPPAGRDRLVQAGNLFFLTLLAVQPAVAASKIVAALRGDPFSRSRDLGLLLRRDGLQRAVVIGDPDEYLEALPYYAPNPLYFMREQRFGRFVRFTRKVRTELSLDDFLNDGHALQARTGRPVVILLDHRLDAAATAFRAHSGRIWYLNGTSEQVRRFQAGTRLLARFGTSVTHESYDVYLLKPAIRPGSAPHP